MTSKPASRLAAVVAAVLFSVAGAAHAFAPGEDVPEDVKRGLTFAPILLEASYEALSPGKGKDLMAVHALEIEQATQNPIIDSKGWKELKQPTACKEMWVNTQSEIAKVAGYFQLEDFHTNEQVELAVVEAGIALSVPAQVLGILAVKTETSEQELSGLCTAMNKALPALTKGAQKYHAQAKSGEYLDLGKLVVTAVSKGIPAWLDAQAAARY